LLRTPCRRNPQPTAQKRQTVVKLPASGWPVGGPTLTAPAQPSRRALLGGEPVRRAPFPSWSVTDSTKERALVALVRSGKWFRDERVRRSLAALGIGPSDEVIVPPYTFVATVNAVLLMHALPVFVDSDIETFQIDARRIEFTGMSMCRDCIVPIDWRRIPSHGKIDASLKKRCRNCPQDRPCQFQKPGVRNQQ
jgi:hypothetical protein